MGRDYIQIEKNSPAATAFMMRTASSSSGSLINDGKYVWHWPESNTHTHTPPGNTSPWHYPPPQSTHFKAISVPLLPHKLKIFFFMNLVKRDHGDSWPAGGDAAPVTQQQSQKSSNINIVQPFSWGIKKNTSENVHRNILYRYTYIRMFYIIYVCSIRHIWYIELRT